MNLEIYSLMHNYNVTLMQLVFLTGNNSLVQTLRTLAPFCCCAVRYGELRFYSLFLFRCFG